MSKFKKVLSALLAMVMLFSVVSIGVEAAYSPYKGADISGYDSIDQPILTTDQYGSMIMDYLDHFLAETNYKLSYDVVGVLQLDLDLTSVDATFASLRTLWGRVQGAKDLIGGDIVKLDFSAIQNAPSRGTPNKTDIDIFMSLFQFLADNSAIVGKVADGTLDLGFLNGFIELGDYLNIPTLLKSLLAKEIYGKKNIPDDLDPDKPGVQGYEDVTIDSMIIQLLFKLVEKYELDQYLPQEVLDLIDLENTSVYDILETAFRQLYNPVIRKLLNGKLKIQVRRLCGVDYSGIPKKERTSVNGDTSNLNSIANYININYQIPAYDFSSWRATDSFMNHVNDIIGSIAQAVDNEAAGFVIQWDYSRGNEGLFDNIINVAKMILKQTGNDFYQEYIKVPTPEEYDAMSSEEFLCTVIAAIINGHVDGIYLKEGQYDSIGELLFYFVKHYAVDYNPSKDYGEFDETLDDPVDIAYSVIDMAMDLLVYLLNTYTNADLTMGAGFDDIFDELAQWAYETYGSALVLEEDGSDAWALLNEIFFSIIPANWLPERDTNGDGIGDQVRDDLYDIVFEDIIGNALDLDLGGILSIFGINHNYTGDNESELAHSLTYVILHRVTSIINFIIPGVFEDEYDNFEDFLAGDVNNSGIKGEKLKNAIVNLLTGLNDRAEPVAAALLPIACMVLDLSTDQEFELPYISLAETVKTTDKSFYISNESSGLNTAATYADGRFVQDELYAYDIHSITTNQSGVTVSPATAVIGGGDRTTFSIVGNPTNNAVLMLTIEYDALNEQGEPMTDEPLIQNVLTYVSNAEDDSETETIADVTTANANYIAYQKTTYINQSKNLSALDSFKTRIVRKYVDNGVSSAITARSVTVNSTLAALGLGENTASGYQAISLSKKGAIASDKPLIVDKTMLIETSEVIDPETGDPTTVSTVKRPASGAYSNTISYTFAPTTSGGAAETINFTQYAYFYDDFKLPSLLSSAVKANRQQSNYDMGDRTVEITEYDPVTEEEYTYEDTLNGADCWDAYVAAMLQAAAVVYKPKTVGTFNEGLYEDAATALKTATTNLAYFELANGVQPVADALYAIEPANAKVLVSDNGTADPSDDVYRSVEYFENGYVFFDRIDFVPYTYGRFHDLEKDAKKMISGESKGKDYSALEIAYLANKLELYGGRLIRNKASANNLQQAVNEASATYLAGNTGYTAKSWALFEVAYNFANSVLAEAQRNPGTVYPGTNYLKTDGIRQSKINTARLGLNEAHKRLMEATEVSYADLTALNAEINNNSKAIYNAGNGSGTYTAESWASFKTAYEAATALVAAQPTSDQQAAVTTALNTLVAARTNLTLASQEEAPEIVFTEDYGDDFILNFTEGLWSDDTGEDVFYIYGANPEDPWISDYNMVDGLINDYDATGSGYEIVWVSLNNDFENYGTGSTIEIWLDGEVIESYPFVMFGDINGDTAYDGTDVNIVRNVNNGLSYDWYGTGFIGDSPQMLACDMNNDWSIDGLDLNFIKNVNNGVIMPSEIDVSYRDFS